MLRMSLRPAHMYVVSLFGMGTKVQTDVVRETAEATVEYQLRLERLQWFAHLQRISTYQTAAFKSRCRSVDSRKAEGDGRFNSSTMGQLVEQRPYVHIYAGTAQQLLCRTGKMWCETRKHGNHSCTDRDCHCGVTLFLNLVNVPKIYKKMHGGV